MRALRPGRAPGGGRRTVRPTASARRHLSRQCHAPPIPPVQPVFSRRVLTFSFCRPVGKPAFRHRGERGAGKTGSSRSCHPRRHPRRLSPDSAQCSPRPHRCAAARPLPCRPSPFRAAAHILKGKQPERGACRAAAVSRHRRRHPARRLPPRGHGRPALPAPDPARRHPRDRRRARRARPLGGNSKSGKTPGGSEKKEESLLPKALLRRFKEMCKAPDDRRGA